MTDTVQTESGLKVRSYRDPAVPAYHSSLSRRMIPALIFLGCLAYLCVFLRYSTLEPDEGIVLQGAERVLAGQIPYRDFFSFYTPGSLYLLAATFRIFGDSFAVARLSLAVVGAICSVLTYLLARRVCTVGTSIFVAVLATTAGTAFRFLVLHNPYSTLGSCLCLYAAVRLLEHRQVRWAFLVGSFASLTFLTEQSKGAGLYLGLVLGFFVLFVFGREIRLPFAAVVAAAGGTLWPLLATFAYFWAHHASGIMLHSWLWPLQHYTRANRVPYGHQNWSDHTRDAIFHTGPILVRIIKILAVIPGLLVPLLPLIAVGLFVFLTLEVRRRSSTTTDQRYYLLVCGVLTGLLVSVVLVRADILHFMYLAPLWYLVLGWILGPAALKSRIISKFRTPLFAFVGTTFGLLSMAVLFSATGARYRIDTRRGAIRTNARDTVIEYVQQHAAPGQQLLVYPYLPLYNYLTATRSPSQYDYFQPGMNTRDQAADIIASMRASTSPVLFEPGFAEKIANSWPQTPLSAIVNDPVSDYIAKNYRVCQQLHSPEGWRFEFMVKKETPCS